MKSTFHILRLLAVTCVAVWANLQAMAQTPACSGTVVDSHNQPLVGVSVIVEGSMQGVTTNADGRFALDCPAGAKLNFSYIGYMPQTLSATGDMSVVMKEDVVAMDEVVVVGVGYGQMRKSDLTGAIASVSAKDLKQGVVTSAEQLLQGKIAGLTVVQGSSEPAAGASMRLRGGTSLSAENSPLVVVDGIPGVDINTVQPQEIVSIDVLKDASSAAIYGSRGANGVIIITTNRSSDNERSSIQYNGYVSVGTAAKNLDLLSADQWREYVRTNDIKGAIDYGGNTDWLKELEQTAVSHSHNFYLSNARANSGYRASATYQNTEGIIKNSYLERLAGSISTYQYGMNKRLRVDMGVSFTADKYRTAIELDHDASQEYYNIFNYAMNQNPTVPVRDENGDYTQIGGTNTQNPVEVLENYYSEHTRYRVLGYGKVEYEFIKGLKAVANLSYEYNSHQERYYQPSYAFTNSTNGYGRRNLGDYRNLQLEAYLSYDKNFGDDHRFNAMFGYSYLKNVYEGFGAERRGFDTDSFLANNLGAGSDFRVGDVYSYKGEAILASFFGRVNYSYKGRYMVTATVRGDGSSRFGANNKWGVFPSASVAWRLSEEKFMEGAKSWLSNLKLRLGFGVTGNQDGIGEYKSLALLGTVGGSYYDSTTGTWKPSYAPSQNANPDLKWETTTQYNIGIDFGFINRLSGSIELYHKKTSDLLWTYPVSQPPYLYSTMLANVGDLVNKGVEFSLNANIMERKNFSWNANLTFAYNHQEITSLSNDQFQDLGTPAGQLHGLSGLSNAYTQMVKEGYPTGAFFGPHCSGIDENGQFIIDDPDEMAYLGSAQPKYNLGFSTTLTYKGLDFNLSAYGMFGQKILNATAMSLSVPSRLPAQNVLDDFLSSGIKSDKIVYSDYWIEDGSFLRLQSITLGYTIPNTKKIGLEKIRVYATVDNVCVLTGYSGVDPEVNISGLDYPGIDICNNYPRPRTYMLGVNITF